MKCILFLLALAFGASKPAVAQKPDSTWVSNVSGDSVNIMTLHPAAIFFMSSQSCVQCVTEILPVLLRHKIHPLVLLLRSGSSAIQRWGTLRTLEFPHFPADTILFENTASPDPWNLENLHGGYYGKYHIAMTPAILLPTKDGHWKPLRYYDLYKNGDLQYKKLENALAGR